MTDTTIPAGVKFRGDSITSVVRDATGITIYMRETRKRLDGEGVDTLRVLDPIRLDYADCSGKVRDEAHGYGWEVKLTRQAAFEKDKKTGKPASVGVKWQAIKELRDHFASGTESWTMASGGGGGLSADTRNLILAVQRVFGLDAETAEEHIRSLSTADRNALRIDPEIKPTLDTIYAEQASASGGTAELIAKLKGLKKA